MKQLLWTIQDEAAFTVFEQTGVLHADTNHLLFNGKYRNAYNWMSNQMRIRIGEPPAGIQYPVWAWYQWEGKRKRMDLRLSGYAKRGTPLVQITFEAETRDFLLSDFDAWHFVLSNHYIADNEQDWDSFYKNDSDNRQSEITASWEKIFDLTRYTPGWDTELDKLSVQATLWEISKSQVKKIEHFIAK